MFCLSFFFSFFSIRLISSLILSKSVLKTFTTLPLAFTSASITCFLYNLSYCPIQHSNSAWVIEDISSLLWKLLKLVFKASNSVLVSIQCVPNYSRSCSAWFLASFTSFSCFSKDMIFLSFSFSCHSTNFLNFSSVCSCSSRDILMALPVPIFIHSFSSCSPNSSSLLVLFLLVGSDFKSKSHRDGD